MTYIAEFHIEIECPTVDSKKSCTVGEPTGFLRYTDQDFYFADESSPGVPDLTTQNTGHNPLSSMYDDDYSTYIHSLYQGNAQGVHQSFDVSIIFYIGF